MKYYNFSIEKYQTGDSSEYANNLFDFTEACIACKTGARVISPHKLKDISTNFDKHLFLTNTRDYFISEQLYEYIKDMAIDVADMAPTVNQKGERMPFYQLTSKRTFPPAKSHDGFVQYEEHCEVCCRDNFSLIVDLTSLPYKAEDIAYVYKDINKGLLKGCDIFNTWECLCRAKLDEKGLPRVLAKPMLIISQKLKDALISFGIDYGDYWEVKFE